MYVELFSYNIENNKKTNFKFSFELDTNRQLTIITLSCVTSCSTDENRQKREHEANLTSVLMTNMKLKNSKFPILSKYTLTFFGKY